MVMTSGTTPHLQPSDTELVLAARDGNAAAFGALLERHRPRMLAAALAIVGYRAEAEDAVQETCLIALMHLASLREPGAVGPWLLMIVRRACLQTQRRGRREVSGESVLDAIDERPSIHDRIEQLELREWVWNALQQLPETLRITTMIRHFGSYDSYEELAVILGIPIGTVRSRLSEARRKLATTLLAHAPGVDDAVRARSRERSTFWRAAFGDIFHRGDSTTFISHFDRDLTIGWSSGKSLRGRQHLASEIDGDLEAGVRLEVEHVISDGGIIVVEGRFVNPPNAPTHCPPGIALVLRQPEDRATAIRLHLAPRPPRTADGD